MSYTKIHIQIIIVVILLGVVIIFASKIKLMNEVSELRKTINALQSKNKSTSEIIIAEVSAYTSRKIETDDTPCINAWGDNICNIHKAGIGIVACPSRFNRLDLIEINGEQFRCLDRMNIRYRNGNYFDIYFGMDLEGAKKFGRQTKQIKIYSQS
jgi:hypothetical protein